MIDLSAPLETLLSLPDEQCALACNARCRAWDEVERLSPLSFGERGQMALAFERRRLWQWVDCHSMDDWLSHRAPSSRTTMYAAWRAARDLEQDVPDLAGIPRQTVETMRGLSSNVRAKEEVIQAAKDLEPAKFEEHIAVTFPNQHIERRKPLKFNTTQSQSQGIEEAIKFAIDQKGALNREQALEYMAHDALECWQVEWEQTENDHANRLVN